MSDERSASPTPIELLQLAISYTEHGITPSIRSYVSLLVKRRASERCQEAHDYEADEDSDQSEEGLNPSVSSRSSPIN
jgi:hypothetical protein